MKKIIYLIFAMIACFSSFDSVAQELTSEGQANFFDVQKAMNEKYIKDPKASGYKQWKRKEWFLEPRMYPSGKVNNIVERTAKAQKELTKSSNQQRSIHGSWSFIGPSSSTITGNYQGGKGRINSIAFHPTNSQVIYVGTSHGGLWKTEDDANTWTNISPRLPLLAIQDVVLDPSNPNIIYLVTGDPSPAFTTPIGHIQLSSFTQGIIRSTDGGQTWNPNITSNSGQAPPYSEIYKLLIHPTNSLIQMMATNAGIYYTDDAWVSMTNVKGNRHYDIEFKVGDPNIVYSCQRNSIARSTDGGLNWSTISDPDFPPHTFESLSNRSILAVSTTLPNLVYCMISGSGNTHTILRSYLNGQDDSWSVVDATTNIVGTFGFYCLAMTIKPTDETTVCIGKQLFGRSTNGGLPASWTTNVGGHNDIHELVYNNGYLYNANDGGLFRSTNDGDTWTEISQGIGNSEIYRISGTPQNSEFYVIGAQDIGSLKRTSNSTTFTTFAGADGMKNMIDYTNQNRIIISGQRGGFFKTETGGPAIINITPGDGAEWVTPAIMDPVNPNLIFVAKDTIYRSYDFGDNWTSFDSPPSSGNLNCIAQSTSNRNRLYVSRDNSIWTMTTALSASGTAGWEDISNGLPNLFITDIVVDPNNEFEVYVTLSGYDGGDKVYRSSSAGAPGTWTNISGSLPNIPIGCIAYHNGAQHDNIYIGTDIGVFYRNNVIGDWVYFSNEMPSVAVTDLYINHNSNTIAAATYGRGLWRSGLVTPCTINMTITSESGGVKHYSVSNSISSSANHPADLGTDINYSSNNYIDLTEGFYLGGHATFWGVAGEGCP